ISVPLRDLVFKNDVIAKQVPGDLRDLSMVLMRVVRTMGQNEVRLDPRLEVFDPSFDLAPLVGEKPVLELRELDLCGGRAGQTRGRRALRLDRTRAGGTQHAPMNVEPHAGRNPA